MPELPAIDVTDFAPPFGCGEYEWGPPADHDGCAWKEHQYHVEVLSWHYHDYMGTHAYVQVWDYAQQDDPGQRWQYMLLLHRPIREYDADGAITGGTWSWVIQCEYEVVDHRPPSHATVGADVDRWVTAPDFLKFILE